MWLYGMKFLMKNTFFFASLLRLLFENNSPPYGNSYESELHLKSLLTLAFDDNLEKHLNLLNTWAKMILWNRTTLFKKDKVQEWK